MATIPKLRPQKRELTPGMIDMVGADAEMFNSQAVLEMREGWGGSTPPTKESWGGLGITREQEIGG